jgi:hypothetical protein
MPEKEKGGKSNEKDNQIIGSICTSGNKRTF